MSVDYPIRKDMLDSYPALLRVDPRRPGENDEDFHNRLLSAYIEMREDYDVYFTTGKWPKRSERFDWTSPNYIPFRKMKP